MSAKPPQARDGADLQIGDTVRYNQLFNESLTGIIVGFAPAPTHNRYYVLTHTSNSIHLPIIEESHITERVNTDYRGMSSDYILALNDADEMQMFDI